MLLRELSDRLFELQLRPGAAGQQQRHALAISESQDKVRMTPNGEATEGVLTRLRKMEI